RSEIFACGILSGPHGVTKRDHAKRESRGERRSTGLLYYARFTCDCTAGTPNMTVTYEAADLDGSEMVLEREGTEVCIRVGPRTLMSSYPNDSKDELGRMIAEAVTDVATPHVLIGGLGLGFTLRAALDGLP